MPNALGEQRGDLENSLPHYNKFECLQHYNTNKEIIHFLLLTILNLLKANNNLTFFKECIREEWFIFFNKEQFTLDNWP